MNILITILVVFGSLVVLFLLIALVTKKDFSIEKTIVINCPKQEVFDYARMLKNQEKYSVWVMKDPNIHLVYTGTDGTIGAASAWESKDKNVGIGEQEIKKLHDGECMEVEVRFKKPFEATNYALTTVSDAGNGHTKLSTQFSGRTKFPMNIVNLFMDKMIGKDMLKNLQNMKHNLEN